MTHTIYALRDPTSDALRYVGATKRLPAIRLANHIAESTYAKAHKDLWIRDVLQAGKTPEIIILEELADNADWRSAEKRWIRRLRSEGADLFNGSLPGKGTRRKVTKVSGHRTSVTFTNQQERWLHAEAGRLGITGGELIRRIIDSHREE